MNRANQTGSTGYVVLLTLVAALGGLLFGYDTAVISGAIGFLKQRFELNPTMEGWTASSALTGCIVGAAVAGILSDWLGRKKALVIAAVLFGISALGSAIPRTLTELIIARIIGGVGVGMAAMLSPLYIAEVSPARIRGRLVSVNQFAIISGMLVVYFVNYFIANPDDEAWNVATGWRWMFGSEMLPAGLFLVMLFFVPESPRWLIKRGRKERALRILTRVGGQQHAQDELAEISKAIAQEQESIERLLLSGVKLVLLIGIPLAVFQQVTGINVFLYYAPEIFKSIAGADTDVALLQTVVVGAVNLSFTIIAIWTVDRIGRKPLMLIGFAGMGLSLFGLGLAAYYNRTDTWVLTFILGYIASFALSVGPVTWVILSEIFPTRIRGLAMAIATFCLWTANYIVSQTFPMMNKNEWLIATFNHAFPFWVYGVLCVVAIVFVACLVPETKGQSLEQIEQKWIKPELDHA
jgi:SP family xylose:H+ symportor-like MFS transporter